MDFGCVFGFSAFNLTFLELSKKFYVNECYRLIEGFGKIGERFIDFVNTSNNKVNNDSKSSEDYW